MKDDLAPGIPSKRVLVTGAGSGIGSGIARLFGRYGAVVGVQYRRSRRGADAVVADIRAHGGDASAFQCDLRDAVQRRRLLRAFVTSFGGIDVLVCNAGGISDYPHFLRLTESSWNTVFALNAAAPFFLARDAFVHMQKQRWGRIINISTAAITYAGPNSLHYTAAKAAMEVVARGLAREGARDNVLVNTIRPGVIDTPMRSRVAGYSEAHFRRRVKLVPVGRAGRSEDIARMVLFLASDAGSFITGECFTVAGGD